MFFPDPSVWVSDSQQPFVRVQKEIPDVVYMKEGQDLVFPCRVTNPNIKVSLVKVSTFAMNNSKTSSKTIPKLTFSGHVIHPCTVHVTHLLNHHTYVIIVINIIMVRKSSEPIIIMALHPVSSYFPLFICFSTDSP